MANTVLVTGGTGYIGGEIIDQLLAQGDSVHTTVRNVVKSEPRLRTRWPDAGDRLTVFQADLENDAGWAEAMAGCDGVAHVASPFPLAVPKDENDLIVPAREGALRALRFAHAAGINRFVLTSSAAAIAYGHPPEKTQFDESDWTQLDGPDTAPYYKSKTVAEREARNWVEASAPDMEFCSINPVAVTGPVANDDLSTSVVMVKMMLEGAVPMAPNMGIGLVDVRNVVDAHIKALKAPAETIRGERFALSEKFLWMKEMAAVLRERVPEHSAKVPTRSMPDFLVHMLAPFMAEMKQIKKNLRQELHVDGSHVADVLGVEYISAEQSLVDTANSLVEHGIVEV